MSITTDEFVPVRHQGRTARFVAQLRTAPGEWRKYPHPVANAVVCASKYAARFPGTEWARDADGNLGARWVGDT